MMTNNKSTFSSRIGYILVAAGAAIGLGNIWRFPYLAYGNGGAAFVIIYILIAGIIGVAGVQLETAIGRHARSNPIAAYRKVNPKSGIIGVVGVLFTYMLDIYYVVVGGYVLKYAVDYLVGTDFGSDSAAYYQNYISDPIIPPIFTAVLLFLSAFCLAAGITKKVEKVSKVIMPMLLVLLIVSSILALMSSSSAVEGLKFYLIPDFSKLSLKTVSDACVQVMFSVGTGWCLYVTLGANVSESENIKKTSYSICLLDTLIALLAGFVVIPSVVGAGATMKAGPSLVFIALTDIFAGVQSGRILGFLFFASLFIAVFSSMPTFIEIPASVLQDKMKISHKKATVITTLAIFGGSLLCSWSQGEGWLSFVQLPWFSAQGISYYCINDWVDCFSSYILMPLGNILVSIFVVKVWGFKNYEKELTRDGRDGKLTTFSKIIIMFGIPALSIIALLNVFGVLV